MPTGTDLERANFGTTLWTEVHEASSADPVRRRAALETLAQAYWPPLYALARRRCLRPEDAQDAVQEFFAGLIEKDGLALADRARGRFRTWLRASFGYFLSDQHDRRSAQKRGGGLRLLALDCRDGETGLVLEPASPDRQFDRDWAGLVLRRALDALRLEYEGTGRGDHFELLRGTLGAEERGMKELAAQFGVGEQDVKNRLFRARRRLRELLLVEVRGHLANPADAESELRDLHSALGSIR